ncbi:MAG: flagellar hook protein FlgE, partial [Myxococcales bacterium]|nr:flagellar hook protein FlgE [Myxococcales bacterium]
GSVAGQKMTTGGAGVRMVRAQQIFTQGALTNTGVTTDLGLSGDGFFVVAGTMDGMTGQFYSRAGQMTLRKDGMVINPQGLELQGYAALPGGGFGSKLTGIQVSTASLAPRSTTEMKVVANLDATETTPTAPWDPQDPAATSNFSTSMTVYDSLGNAHQTEIYFRKTGPNTWEYHGLVDGSEVTPVVAGNDEWVTGQLTFTTDGALQSDTVTAGGTIDFTGATPGQAITLDLGDPISGGGTGQLGLTQYGSPSGVSSQQQDGYTSGELSGLDISADGIVSGIYTNGETVAAGQIAVAKFQAQTDLGRAGHNLWVKTRESGEPAIGAAGGSGRAAVVSGTLESSNVDIAAQFVDMIAHQRAFSANSKTIQTADEMLSELVNLKR